MYGFFAIGGMIMWAVWVFQLAIKVWAMLDCLRRRADAFPAVDRLTKPAWLGILGLTLLTGFAFGPLNFFSIVGDVAAGAYLVDVRPRIKSITGG